MQTTLLGLAIAIILAIVAAIVAPLVVDWNHYRAPIEAEASRLTGLNVRVNGAIDARLLPSPVITLTDVEVGGAGQPPQLRAETLKLELSLGPLLRGKVEASQADLIAPRLAVALDRSGAIEMPTLAPAFRASALSIAHFTVEDGRVIVSDAASGARLVLQKLWFDGDIGSLAGPFTGSGAAVAGNQLYGYRISGGPAQGGTRITLSIDPSDRPLTTQFEGLLTFSHGVPQLEGTMSAARPVGAALANGRRVVSEPWHATGTLRATPAAASLRNVAFRYGPEERAVDFAGSAELTFGAHPHLSGQISAMQVDVDRALADPEVTDQPPLLVLRSFLQTFAGAAKPPMPAQISVRIDALIVGGTTIDSLAGALDFDRGQWTINSLQLHAPGMTAVSLSGRLTGTAQRFSFSGPATLDSADAGTLLAWIGGRHGSRAANEVKTFHARGDVTIASERVAVERLDAALNQEKIDGRLAYDWATANRPARLDAELRAGELDIDALSTFAKAAIGGRAIAAPQAATLALQIGKATFAGVEAQAVDAQMKLDAGTLQIDRFSIGDLAGAKLDVGGRIDELSSQPRGQITLDLEAGALDGLSDIAAKLAPRYAALVRHAAGRLAPANVHAVLNVKRAPTSGSSAALSINGNLAAMRIAVNATARGEPSRVTDAAVQIDGRMDADDGAALVALFGLDRVLAVDQLPGRLTLSAAGPLNGDIHVDGKLEASGLESAMTGKMRLSADGVPSGQLRVQAAAADLRPVHQMMTGQPGVAVAVDAHAAVALDGAKASFTDIAATVGDGAVHGHVAVGWGNPVAIDGTIATEGIDAASVMGVLLGIPSNSTGQTWSSAPIGSGAFAAVKGEVKFKFDRAEFTSALIASQLTGVAHFYPSAISLDNVTGELAGGHIAGAMTFQRNADALGAHLKIDLADVDATTLIGPSLDAAGGRLSVTFSSDGFGGSPAGLLASLRGIGAVTLKDVQFAGLDAAAFDAARQAAGTGGPIDMAKVQAAVKAALANGRLAVPNGAAAFTIASGAIDLNHATLQAQGGVELSLNGAIDLGNAALDARMTLSEPPPASALIGTRPELAIDIKGPLAAPQRTPDMSALTGWLTLSAAELQTRRIELIEAEQHGDTATQSAHPGSLDVRLVAPGEVIETAIPPDLPQALPSGARGIERLQPPPAPPAPPPQGGAGGVQKGAGTRTGPPMMLRPGALAAPAPRRPAETAAAGAAGQNRRPSAPAAAAVISPGSE